MRKRTKTNSLNDDHLAIKFADVLEQGSLIDPGRQFSRIASDRSMSWELVSKFGLLHYHKVSSFIDLQTFERGFLQFDMASNGRPELSS